MIAASDQNSSLWRCFEQVRLGRPTTCWRNYLSQLACKLLGISQEEQEDVVRAALLSLLPSDLDQQPKTEQIDGFLPSSTNALEHLLLAWCFADDLSMY